jgi:hypothetical protein
MSSTSYKVLQWAVKEMEEHAAHIRKTVPAPSSLGTTSRTEMQDIFIMILDLADWIDKVSIQCSEVVSKYAPPPSDAGITSEDEVVAAEWDKMPRDTSPRTMEEHCDWWGMNYDSNQSRGIN